MSEVRADGFTDEERIRQLVAARVAAARVKDVAAATSSFAAGVVLFDVVNPLRYEGGEALRARSAQWFESFDGPIELEIRDLKVATAGDVAFSHCLQRVNASTKAGSRLVMWWRSTTCYRKVDGDWQIAHEHNSVPFDPQTGKASLDLVPSI